MRFAVNVAMLFDDRPLLERFAAAADAGFDAVELWWTPPEDHDAVVAAAEAAGVRVLRFALDHGAPAPGAAGLLCMPDEVERFRASAHAGAALARRLGCRMVNALAGKEDPRWSREEQLEQGRRNLQWLADLLAPDGVDVLLEPNNPWDKPGYLVTTTDEALTLLDAADRRNVRLLLDIYHAQRVGEELVPTIRRVAGRLAHVQVGDVPGRGAPGTGTIDWKAVLTTLHDVGYRGAIGLEHRPGPSLESTFGWLPQSLRAADLDRADLVRVAPGPARGEDLPSPP